jgi:hypothetical protein
MLGISWVAAQLAASQEGSALRVEWVIRVIGYKDLEWIRLAQVWDHWRAPANILTNIQV